MFGWLKPKTIPVYVQVLGGEWRRRNAVQTPDGLFCALYPAIESGGHFLLPDGTAEGPYITKWRRA